MTILPTHLETLQKLMDATMLRQQAISQNIANVNTPGYHRKDVLFEDQLAEQLNSGQPIDLSRVTARVIETPGLASRIDGNNVDIDQEMGALSKNTMMFRMYTQLLGNKIRMVNAAIRGQS